MKNLIILSEEDISRLAKDEIVPLRDNTGKEISVIMSERAYKSYLNRNFYGDA